MFVLNILATGLVIGIVQSSPTSAYQKGDVQLDDRPELLLFNQIHGIENADMLESSPGRSAGGSRIKRLGSLSIVNPLDVLRERVLLELARRKMRQNQRQVDANRRLLQTIGKRAITNAQTQFGMDSNEDTDPTNFASSKPNDYIYAYRIQKNDIENSADQLGQHNRITSDRGTGRHRQLWDNHGDDDPVVQEVEDDQTRRMANELSLL